MSNGDVFLSLVRASHQALDELQSRLRHLKLTAAELTAMASLMLNGPQSANDLARESAAKPAAMTSILDRLESRGLVTRERNTVDRRRIRIQLTAHGSEVGDLIVGMCREIETSAIQSSPEAQLVSGLLVLGSPGHFQQALTRKGRP